MRLARTIAGLAVLSGLAQGALRIEYLGHASFLIEDPAGNRVLTDPFLNGYPLPFPQRLSVDVVAVSQRDPAHDSAHQLRGRPVVLGADRPSAAAGALKVDGLPLPERMAYVIRNGAQSIVFLGEAAGNFSPELEQAVRSADVVLASPRSRQAVQRLLKDRAKPPAIVLMRPDSLQPAPQDGDWRLPTAREMDALEVRQDMAPGVIALKPRTVPQEAPDHSVFHNTIVEMSWPQIQLAAQEEAVVLLPVGVIEAHGPHMGLGADTYLAHSHATAVRRELGVLGIKAVVAPPVYWGLMVDTAEFPGSFQVRPETMAGLLEDVMADLKKWGFRRVFCVNQHGDGQHRRIVSEALAAAKRDLGLETYDVRRIEAPLPVHDPGGRPDAIRPDYHAGAGETRLMADGFPEDVDLRLATRLEPQSRFRPLAYVGDPASWAKENELSFYWKKSAQWDAERIAYVLGRPVPAPAAPVAVAPSAEVEAILARHIQAVGGRARIEAARTLVRTGKLWERTMEIPLVVRAASGGKWSLSMGEGPAAHVEVFNGNTGWRTEGAVSAPMSVERVAFLAPLLDAHSPLRLKEFFPKLTVLPDENREGRLLRRLSAETITGFPVELAFDAQTGLLRRIGDAVLDDYREVNGVKWPFTIDIGGGALKARIETAESGLALDAAAFERPAAAAPAAK
ncbi:MAG: creatininase family protein [Bryobacteraceae bacterium]